MKIPGGQKEVYVYVCMYVVFFPSHFLFSLLAFSASVIFWLACLFDDAAATATAAAAAATAASFFNIAVNFFF